MTTATSICVSGNIGFVGLVIPHMMRMILGPDHRILLPASALGGAMFLVIMCIYLGRIVNASRQKIRVGIMTCAYRNTVFFIFTEKNAKEI